MSTAREYFEQTLPVKLTPEMANSVGAIYQFNIAGDGGGNWTVDLNKGEDWISEGEADNADCVISMKEKTFLKIIAKKTKPEMAFMMGQVKVAGNLALSLKLGKILN